MEEKTKAAVMYALAKAASIIGIDISGAAPDKDTERICSLASELSAGNEPVKGAGRGLSSVFDRLWLKQGEAPAGNILYIDDSGMFRCCGKGEKLNLKKADISRIKSEFIRADSIKSRFEIMKKYAQDIPCTKSGELSVYCHARLSSAFAAALAQYYNENPLGTDEQLKQERSLVLYTADFSGIQNFIYTITNEDALKRLRAKSFFIEIVMAQLTSEITDSFGLTDANVLYSGGGHCYMLLPCIKECREKLEGFHKNLNIWSMKNFGNSLSVVWEMQECSPNEFLNIPNGSYTSLFSGLSGKMAEKKMQRYSADEIRLLNRFGADTKGTRECKVCGLSSKRVKDGGEECEWCSMFSDMSNAITDPDKCFVITKNDLDGAVPFFSHKGECRFSLMRSSDISRKSKNADIIRIFCKNKYPSKELEKCPYSSIIDVCDYASDKMLSNIAESASGIKRIGVLRMDVDNLGSTFISGFDKDYVNIGRTAALSSHLSGFFKKNLTAILAEQNRNINVLYAGGDDVFLVGSWDNVIYASVDIIDAFKSFTGGKLSASGGIGIYERKYPVAKFAYETERLEACSKNNKSPVKDSITLFTDDGSQTYGWDEFFKKVLGEKLDTLHKFIKEDSDKGNSFLYNLMEHLRGIIKGEKINIARAAYLLARMCMETVNKENKKDFSDKVFDWITSDNKNDIKQLITAITIFVYRERSRKQND